MEENMNDCKSFQNGKEICSTNCVDVLQILLLVCFSSVCIEFATIKDIMQPSFVLLNYNRFSHTTAGGFEISKQRDN